MSKKENDIDDSFLDDDLEGFDDFDLDAEEDQESSKASASDENFLEDTAVDLKVDEDEMDEMETSSSDTQEMPVNSTLPADDFGLLNLASDVPVQLIAIMAKKTISMQDLAAFHKGSVIELNRPPSEQVDLVANGKLVARGELVEIDGKLGVRIIKLIR
ncbi:MAG: hypothetical protein COX62_06370 [Deltaproteobacteria bacterium CG_4_10_14_0_2_um_filter_43_8]|nr:MAG: hypothetical protein COV43_05400 [Deltaproteobacteria bacterium CG11_big_fil_rev_8_21_14_0_20_42_23]PJA19597.1 MAG: hypothetical protein COX62_06370 [Deltaproteobacteria bacterium CG_4_10_14_0_2_um_filter_43_8]PJC64028.1 MAG: hypothetical protein CO021_06375 [Deltaproteobacteria bacterium CG_4_9_14_0_2_um_filter_42_21]